MVKSEVLDRVFEHADFVDIQYQKTHTRFFTALQGSQNYRLDDVESDVDTKTLVVPRVEDLILNKSRVSTTLLVEPTIEHADVKDIREMFTCFRKQNINFLEILFTPYVDVNPLLAHHYSELYAKREDIARLNPYQGLRAMVGHLMEKYHAFEHPYPSIIDKIERYGYDPKQLHHMVRFKEFLIRFIKDGDSYEDCLIPKDPKMLIAIKRGAIPYDAAKEMREEHKIWADEFLAEWKPKLVNEEDPATSKFMDDLLLDVFLTTYNTEVGR